tara:strand:+ start:3071 stop:3667 length:597 start_codon:yes stop_codon:yes gene_type:complete
VVANRRKLETAEHSPTARRILNAAGRCFQAEGIAKVTIVDISKAAKYSRPIIYRHFGGKDDIVDHLCLDEMQIIQSKLNEIMPREMGFTQRLVEIITQAVILSLESPYIQVFMQNRKAWLRSQTAGSDVHSWVKKRWQAYLAYGQRHGMLAADLEIEEAVNWIAMSQSMLLMRFEGQELVEADIRRLVSRFVVRPLVG